MASQKTLTPCFLHANNVDFSLSGCLDDGSDPLQDRVPLVLDVCRRRENKAVLDQANPDGPRRSEALGRGLERVSGNFEVVL